MKYIIELPEEVKEKFDNATKDDIYGSYYDYNSVIGNAIKNGTPLPEGHGDLIDRSKLLVELECGIRAGNYEEGYEKYPHINDMDDCFDTVKYADTIIEADKENK